MFKDLKQKRSLHFRANAVKVRFRGTDVIQIASLDRVIKRNRPDHNRPTVTTLPPIYGLRC
jgi:hypothetical protein